MDSIHHDGVSFEAVKATWYFEERVLKIKRPCLRRECCEAVVHNSLSTEVQPDGRETPSGIRPS